MNLMTWIYTKCFGELVGSDEFGNMYFRRRAKNSNAFRSFGRENRWLIPKTSSMSPLSTPWFLWLHYQVDLPPTKNDYIEPSSNWEKSPILNPTGTALAYSPLKQEFYHPIKKSYESWRPV
jgi:NADH:ubiquinone oxidoreductase subunit